MCLATTLAPGPDDRPDRQHRHDGNDLAAQDDLVDVDRGPPTDGPVLDDERADRAAGHPEAGTAALVVAAVGPLATDAAAGTAAHLGRRDDHDPVLHDRVADGG